MQSRPPATASHTLRPARADDLAAARRLVAAAQLPLDGLEDQFGPAYAVAEVEGRLVGVAGVEVFATFGLLRSVAVDPSVRGRGVGDALVRDRLGWADGRGLAAVYLLTTTASDYFPRFGFVRVGRDVVPPPVRASREFASVCPASAIAMERAGATR